MIAPSLVHRWISLVGAEHFFMAYGMTEGLGLAALRADEWVAHPGSVGRGYRDTEIRILDQEGNEVPAGTIQEFVARAKAQGIEVKDRGRVPAELVVRFRAATGN